MESNDQNADLHQFFKQLLNVENMLEKASWYNQSLTVQIDKLKKIVNCNQNIFGKEEDGDQNTKFHGDNLDELMNTSLTSHATNIQEKVMTLKNNTISYAFQQYRLQLFITTALFEDFKSQHRKKGNTDFKLCQQLSGLGASLISIGNEIRIMRQDNAAIERKSKICWTQCKAPKHNNTQIDGTLCQKIDVKQTKLSVREMRFYKTIIDKSMYDAPR